MFKIKDRVEFIPGLNYPNYDATADIEVINNNIKELEKNAKEQDTQIKSKEPKITRTDSPENDGQKVFTALGALNLKNWLVSNYTGLMNNIREVLDTKILSKLPHGGYGGTGQDLKNAIDKKQDINDRTLQTKSKVVAGAINENKTNIELIHENAQVTDNPYNVYKRPYGAPTNVDAIDKSGIYQIENHSNTPVKDHQGTLIHTQWASKKTLGFQMFNANYTNRFFLRARGTTSDPTQYKKWVELFTTETCPLLKSQTGVQRLGKEGLIIQWGKLSNPTNHKNKIYLPASFSNNTYIVLVCVDILRNDGATSARTEFSSTRTNSYFETGSFDGNNNYVAPLNWIAIGY